MVLEAYHSSFVRRQFFMAKGIAGDVDTTQRISWSYKEGQQADKIPWGPHKLPVLLDLEDISIAVEKNNQSFLYRRYGAGENVEKIILANKGILTLNPVEPLHKPAEISNYLLIEFDQLVIVEPRSKQEVYLTFPLEVACLLEQSGVVGGHLIDIFSFCCSKLTLYGNVKNGLVCRYWKSLAYTALPAINPLEQGIMKLEIHNSLGRWTEVRRAVFSAFGMKLYYGTDMVSLDATMKINKELNAETNFNDKPLRKGMSKAVEQFAPRLIGLQGRMVMEEGY